MGAVLSTGAPLPRLARSSALGARGIALALVLAGCGGGAPLLHPAHVLSPGETMVGAGLSGQLALQPLHPPASVAQNQESLQDLAIAPGVAPWAAGRLGLEGSNEAGLTYSGRTFRVDARHAFPLGKAALSVGLGASAVLAQRPGEGDANGVYGGGADLPILIGVRSSSDLYSFWFGPRAGFEFFRGGLQLDPTSATYDVSGKHLYAGLTAGARVGFRHVHLALELNAAYHHADGAFTVSPTSTGPAPAAGSTNVQQLSLTPAGALEVSF